MRKTRDAFTKNGIQYADISGMSQDERSELTQKAGKHTVPQVFVHGVCVGGCNDGAKPWHGALKLLNAGKLKKAIDGRPEDAEATLSG